MAELPNKEQIVETLKNEERHSEIKRFLRVFLKRKVVAVSCVILTLTVIAAIFAPWLAPYDPYKISPADKLQPPSINHWLGTDNIGRDTLSRIIYGARTSLIIGLVAVSCAAIIGQTLGIMAAFFGGAANTVIMRMMDALMCLPPLMNAIVVSALLGGGMKNVIIAMTIGVIPIQARLMYAQAISVKQNEYVLASTTLGANTIRTIFRHILPNSYPPLLVLMTIDLGIVILGEAGLSFLGLGIKPPIAAWGSMVNDGYPYILTHPWLSFAPGIAIMAVVFSFNMLGDGLRDTLDPRLRGTL